jgi:tRNA pseudouridine38-40 synthase
VENVNSDKFNSPNDIGPSLDDEVTSVIAAHTPYRRCAEDHTRVRMHISYDGTDFMGWQRQTTLPSVQGTLEKAISQICGKPTRVLGASRTDSGVHANQQVAHFDCPKDPGSFDFRYSLQSMTPESVVVEEMFIAPVDFHAIAQVTDKVYRYRVFNRVIPSALLHRYSYWVRFPLDLAYLNEASKYLVGKQDFKSFQSSGTKVLTTVREIFAASWTQPDEHILEFSIRGNGFLKQMVRNIVGTLIYLNQDEAPTDQVKAILGYQDRRKAGPTAPAQGLFLDHVNYPESVDNGCRKL